MAKRKSEEPVNRGMLDEAVKTILDGIDNLFGQHGARLNSIDKKLYGVDKKLEKLEAEVYFIKQDVRDIKTEISDMPSEKEFNDLKIKVGSLQA